MKNFNIVFEAIIDEELEPGDILYIPPGFPHEGYALENAMNYSVGFRAPNTRELISGFADYVLQRELGGNYYSDPDVPPRAHPADVLPQEMDKLREMMLELINQPEHFKQWFGEFISQSRHELDIAPPEPPSPMITAMTGTLSLNISRRFTAMASDLHTAFHVVFICSKRKVKFIVQKDTLINPV